VRQIMNLSLINRTNQERVVSLTLPSELQAIILLEPAQIVLPPNKKVEVRPVIDIPRTKFTDSTLETTLFIRENSGAEHQLMIRCERP
jgi:hypothetical protein